MHIGINFWRSTTAGIAGTGAMTFFVYLVAYISKRRFKVVRILGTMLTFRTTIDKGLSLKPSTIIAGGIAHYKVGITFAAIYAWLWMHDIGAPDFANALLFGFVNGLLAVIAWWWFIALHPNPPLLPLPSYLFTIFLGHFIFALGVTGTYRLLQ
jgi:hypothetical protein